MGNVMLFDKQGFFNAEAVLEAYPEAAYYMIIGARGTGKTYSALKLMQKLDRNFVYLRRTVTELDTMLLKQYSPYKGLNDDMGSDIRIWRASKQVYTINDTVEEEDEKTGRIKSMPGEVYGTAVPLSVLGSFRSLGGSAKYMVFDEFIPETHVRYLKNEDEAFANAYETVNRNREIERILPNGEIKKAEPPLKVFLMANANDLANPLLLSFGVSREIDKMRKRKARCKYFKEQRLVVVDLVDSPISVKKASTALYQLTKGTTFYEMAIENKFGDVNNDDIVSRPLKEYLPVVSIGPITIYKHKSKALFYVSEHESGSPRKLAVTTMDIINFKRTYMYLWWAAVQRQIEFEDRICKIYFHKFFD